MKCTICEQNHDKEGLEYCVAALVVKNQKLEKQVKDIDLAVRKNDWTRALKECLRSRDKFLGS